MFHHTDTLPLVLSPVDSDPEAELIDNKNADKLAFKYNKSFSEFSFSPFKKVSQSASPSRLTPPCMPVSQSHRSCPHLAQSHRSCPHLAALPRAPAESDEVRVLCQGRDEDLLASHWGELSVTRTGAPTGPVLLTLHDIGLDYKSNFQV